MTALKKPVDLLHHLEYKPKQASSPITGCIAWFWQLQLDSSSFVRKQVIEMMRDTKRQGGKVKVKLDGNAEIDGDLMLAWLWLEEWGLADIVDEVAL